MQKYLGLLLALALGLARAQDEADGFIWPISGTATPDAMNTSFGPRLDFARWNFHDGIDLPQPADADCTGDARNTPVHAVRGGTVYKAGGPGGGYSSNHVVLKMNDPAGGGELYVYYFHLKRVNDGMVAGAAVRQGDEVGVLGTDDASYCHLHLEFRKGGTAQDLSIHPLRYLPYTDTANFTAPADARFNRIGGAMAARLSFSAPSRLEGDLARVEVDILDGATVLETRTVDFDDARTVRRGMGDALMYNERDIAVEGYQESPMSKNGVNDLSYGVMVRNLPANGNALVARVTDVRGNVSASAPVPVPDQMAADWNLDFEDGALSPAGWTPAVSAGAALANVRGAGYEDSRGLAASDSERASGIQFAGIAAVLPAGRFQWSAEAWVMPASLALVDGESVFPLFFLTRTGVAFAAGAGLQKWGAKLYAGMSYLRPDGTVGGKLSDRDVLTGQWNKWTFRILRNGTRNTTLVVLLNDAEVARTVYDAAVYEVGMLRAGLGYSWGTQTSRLVIDNLKLSDSVALP
ncbi:M23 family metallopeptidase [Massilia sp. SM-13]|uniref:M23 family metallopeptidase n=1 Tax=Pseudoduganella rhizocola TaxID=3382643 RepID=UPI0038B55A11